MTTQKSLVLISVKKKGTLNVWLTLYLYLNLSTSCFEIEIMTILTNLPVLDLYTGVRPQDYERETQLEEVCFDVERGHRNDTLIPCIGLRNRTGIGPRLGTYGSRKRDRIVNIE